MKIVLSAKVSLIFIFLLLVIFLYSCEQDSVTDEQPVARFNFTSLAAVPVTVQFVNTSVAPVGTTTTYTWDFGDGITQINTIDAIHTYTQLGTYMVKLAQIPSIGSPDTFAVTLSVFPSAGPSGTSNRLHGIQAANFNYAIVSRAYTATFTNTSTGASSYVWKFGDGATSTTDSATVTHTYLASGAYHVNLTANSSSGTDTSGVTITF